ncbi:MAG: CpsD/CapB family tyrosine-protein kinase [Acidobacteria bacterium]|nr:CpsD/CapB family tyrosine-protein kinase [Acidobacteriota bacterium]
MSKVFEALRRHQQDRGKSIEGSIDESVETGLSAADDDFDTIGSPADARSADGAVFAGLQRSSSVEDPFPSSPVIRKSRLDLSAVAVERISIPDVHSRLILLTDPDSAECEQFRSLRTQLFHAAENRDLKVVTVTSALAGEGKTSTLLNLALAIAQSKEKRVLVIDGDLRRPNIAAYLGLRPAAGLGETLAGSAGLLDAIRRIDGSELYVLPVIGESPNPTEQLSSACLGEILTELRGCFDFILVDSPPVMPFTDAQLLANHSDGVMMVVRAEMAPYESVEKALATLPASRMLGVVLNGADHDRDSGYYDYYYQDSRRAERDNSWRGRLRAMAGGSRRSRSDDSH